MKQLSEISAVLPCYNEAGNIEPLVNKMIGTLNEVADDWEIVIVDDGSIDGTDEVLGRLAERSKSIRVVTHPENQGYGAALRSGFLAAKKKLVFYTDGDGQFDPTDISRLLPLLPDYEIVSAYREKRSDSFLRRVNAAIYGSALCLLFGFRLRDVDCAFKIYPGRLFREIEIISDGAVVDAEILIKAKKLGYRIGQVGVTHFPRQAGKQTGANLTVVARAFRELFKLRFSG
jgi:glycosyltransferase involved in cell wall biosynthesis